MQIPQELRDVDREGREARCAAGSGCRREDLKVGDVGCEPEACGGRGGLELGVVGGLPYQGAGDWLIGVLVCFVVCFERKGGRTTMPDLRSWGTLFATSSS